jgi:hypothetical protein
VANRPQFPAPRLTFRSQLHRFRSDLEADPDRGKSRTASGDSPELSMILDKAQVKTRTRSNDFDLQRN